MKSEQIKSMKALSYDYCRIIFQSPDECFDSFFRFIISIIVYFIKDEQKTKRSFF